MYIIMTVADFQSLNSTFTTYEPALTAAKADSLDHWHVNYVIQTVGKAIGVKSVDSTEELTL